MLSAITDSRCCDFGLGVDGRTLGARDDDLIERFPPYCIDCRTSANTLTEKQARERGCTPVDRMGKLPSVDFCGDWMFYHPWRDR